MRAQRESVERHKRQRKQCLHGVLTASETHTRFHLASLCSHSSIYLLDLNKLNAFFPFVHRTSQVQTQCPLCQSAKSIRSRLIISVPAILRFNTAIQIHRFCDTKIRSLHHATLGSLSS